jgi:hypothetical protein
MEKRDMLGEIKEKTNAVIIKEFSKDGAMMQYNSMEKLKEDTTAATSKPSTSC